MPDIEITRKQIIVVGEVGTNSYGDLTWTDKEGGSYKVGVKRKQYFEKVIVPDTAVELSYAMSSFGKEYIYRATVVKDILPATSPVSPKVEALEREQMAKAKPPKTEMSKDDWVEKDRITRKSIERQTALKEANLRVPAGESSGRVIATAKLFEAYLGGYSLVKEAKKLIEKEDVY